jgi:LPS-assembly lipoprotein
MKRRIFCAGAVNLLLAGLLLSGCGFQLRGSGGARTMLPFSTAHIAAPSSPALANILRQYLVSGGTTIVEDRNTADAVIEILNETRERTVLSLNSQGRIREYNLNYRVQFRVRDPKNAELLPTSDINLRRILSFNESQALAKEAEEATLYRDMQVDMVQQILRRLEAAKPLAAR